MSIRKIFCQDKAIDRLQRALAADKLPHAYIFAGCNGVGKFATARQWAKLLLCNDTKKEKTESGIFHDSCGKCPSCLSMQADTHPDFKVIYKELVKFTRDGKNKTTPVDMPKDVIDEFLIEKVASRPTMSNFVVYVVREGEKLNAKSQNALLKVLEEPPKHCLIILLCSKMENLLPTTRSRCQIIRFGEIDEQVIIGKLTEIGIGKKQAEYWARFSQGSLGDAIEWAEMAIEDDNCYRIKKELIEMLAKNQLSSTLELAEWTAKMSKKISLARSAAMADTSKTDISRKTQKGLIRMMIAAFSDVMRVNLGQETQLINQDQVESVKILAGRFDAEQAAEKINVAYENMKWVDASVNEKLIFEELLLNFAGCGTMRG